MTIGGTIRTPYSARRTWACSIWIRYRCGLASATTITARGAAAHAPLLQESIQLVPRWDVEQLAELVGGNPAGPVRVNGQGFQRGSRQITSFFGELRDDIVRKIQPDSHRSSLGLIAVHETMGNNHRQTCRSQRQIAAFRMHACRASAASRATRLVHAQAAITDRVLSFQNRAYFLEHFPLHDAAESDPRTPFIGSTTATRGTQDVNDPYGGPHDV